MLMTNTVVPPSGQCEWCRSDPYSLILHVFQTQIKVWGIWSTRTILENHHFFFIFPNIIVIFYIIAWGLQLLGPTVHMHLYVPVGAVGDSIKEKKTVVCGEQMWSEEVCSEEMEANKQASGGGGEGHRIDENVNPVSFFFLFSHTCVQILFFPFNHGAELWGKTQWWTVVCNYQSICVCLSQRVCVCMCLWWRSSSLGNYCHG